MLKKDNCVCVFFKDFYSIAIIIKKKVLRIKKNHAKSVHIELNMIYLKFRFNHLIKKFF